MKSRIKTLENAELKNPLDRIRFDLYPAWRSGADTEGIRRELEMIFEDNPAWRHNPPPRVGRDIWMNWKKFTGHKLLKK